VTELRPLTAADAEAAAGILRAAFEDEDRRAGREVEEVPAERVERLIRTIERFTRTDPDGCWAAGDDELAGFSVAIRRGSLWGLSLLFVDPEVQDRGMGRRLLEQALQSADGASVGMIQASEDPRAIRLYSGAGFAAHPAFKATGTPDRTELPAGLDLRAGGLADLDLVEAVDTVVRGSSRAGDVAFVLDIGGRMLVSDRAGERGYVVYSEDSLICLGAEAVAPARLLLWGALAEIDGDLRAYGWTAAQNWAVEVALSARLSVVPSGPLFLRGLERPLTAWLPSGIYF
jgi:GNAT superfamily N-acetyltransferase